MRFNPDLPETASIREHGDNMQAYIKRAHSNDSESVQALVNQFRCKLELMRKMIEKGLSPNTPYEAIEDLLHTQYIVLKAGKDSDQTERIFTVQFARWLND